MVNLTRDSWHASFYTWFWQEWFPDSLCVYFWKMVIGLFAVCIGLPIIIAIVLFSIYGVIQICSGFADNYSIYTFFLGLMHIALAVLPIICYGCIHNYIADDSQIYENTLKIPVEFTKAKINRICPKINWV